MYKSKKGKNLDNGTGWISVLKKEYVRQQLECEVRESLEHKLVLRREAPLIGLVAFSIALWGFEVVYGCFAWLKRGFSALGFQRAFPPFQLRFHFAGDWVAAYLF